MATVTDTLAAGPGHKMDTGFGPFSQAEQHMPPYGLLRFAASASTIRATPRTARREMSKTKISLVFGSHLANARCSFEKKGLSLGTCHQFSPVDKFLLQVFSLRRSR